jgi:hypothetical protein
MPTLATVLRDEDLRRKARPVSGLDLGPYLAMVDAILAEGGVGGTVALGADEQSRVEKGRLTRAAKARGRTLVWRKAPAGQLRFVLAEPDGPVPGARRRRPAAEQQAEQVVIDAVMTEDVADVTDTTAAAERTEAAAPAQRRQGRRSM